MSVSVRKMALEPRESPESSTKLHLAVLGAVAGLALILGVLSVGIRWHPGPLPGDVDSELVVQHALLPHPFLSAPLEAISTLNWPTPTTITMAAIVGVFLLLRRWLDVVVAPAAAIVSSVATFELSRWVHRLRPSGHGIHPLQVITHTYSFPSGHVTYAVTVFGLFLFLTTQVRRPIHPALIGAIRALLVALIVLMPLSRVLEGEHWPSDVLAGFLDGLIWLSLFSLLYLWLRARWPRLLAPDER